MTLAGFPVQRLHCGWLSLHSKAVRLSTRRRPSAISTLSAFALVATVALGILFAGTEPAIAQNSVSICSRTQQVQTAILAELPDGGYVNRCVNDIRRRPSQPLIQWRFHPHTVHRGRRLRSTQGPSDA